MAQAFDDKKVGETYPVAMDFDDRLDTGVTIDSCDCTVTLLSGSDASPSALLSGAATVSGTQVVQVLTGGTAGCQYRLVFTATTSEGYDLMDDATIKVRA